MKNFLNLIEAKRDGERLTPEQIQSFVSAAVCGQIPDYQIAAFLMAVYFRGLHSEETEALTLAMRDSGKILNFSEDPRPLVDKHSTGGVGDKVSIVLAPLLASLDLRVPMISGRGLGITGGTLDKIESIPGFRTGLTPAEIVAQVQEIGCAICGQTADLAPADQLLYSLRDVTGTVSSIPLFTSSILAKKLAECASVLVLDVKVGRASYSKGLEEGRALGRSLVSLGRACGIKTRALLTRMDAPLGRSVGNWLEVKEAVLCLEGDGAADLRELVLELAAHILLLAGRVPNLEEGLAQAAQTLSGGAPHERWERMLLAQGADLAAYERKLRRDHAAPWVIECPSTEAGYIAGCDGRLIGELVRDLGGGRLHKDTALNLEVGVDGLAKPGDPCGPSSILGRIHADSETAAHAAAVRLRQAFTFSPTPPSPPPLIAEILD